MKKTLLLLLFFAVAGFHHIQAQLTTSPSGGNKKASTSEQIGIVQITIKYDRPGVKGREGKIWGTQVAHYGFQNLGFGTSKASPWRAGSNENTTITFSHNVKIEGKDLAAGTYGLFMALEEKETTVIFSQNSTSWGSYYYNEAEDALRVKVKNEALEQSVEWLKYEFINQTDNSATVALMWEKRMIPFKVEADIHKIQIASFKNELRTTPGFNWQSFVQAANYCVQNKMELELALEWAEQGVSAPFIGQKNFQTLSTKAAVLNALGKKSEADVVMKEALPIGSVQEIHQYARSLVNQKRTKDAFDVFQMNYNKNPNQFTTNFGLARGYSAMGDFKKAVKYLKLAAEQAPDDNNKTYTAGLLKKLEANQDIN